jgi:hypothetical protein
VSFMLSINHAEGRKQVHYTECLYAEFRYAECCYAECRGAKKSLVRLAPVVKHPVFFNPLSDEPPLHHVHVEWILGNQGTCRHKVIIRKE